MSSFSVRCNSPNQGMLRSGECAAVSALMRSISGHRDRRPESRRLTLGLGFPRRFFLRSTLLATGQPRVNSIREIQPRTARRTILSRLHRQLRRRRSHFRSSPDVDDHLRICICANHLPLRSFTHSLESRRARLAQVTLAFPCMTEGLGRFRTTRFSRLQSRGSPLRWLIFHCRPFPFNPRMIRRIGICSPAGATRRPPRRFRRCAASSSRALPRSAAGRPRR